MSNWISVADRLPPNDVFVLTSIYDGREGVQMYFTRIASRLNDDWIDGDNGKIIDRKYGTVVYWMPLPDDPSKSSLAPYVDDQQKLKEANNAILSRLNRLETHIVNLVIPMRDLLEVVMKPEKIQEIERRINRPLQIDDRKFTHYMNEALKKIELFHDRINSLNYSKTLDELNYICKKLIEIDTRLNVIEKEGIRKNIHLDISMEGHQLVKRIEAYKEEKVFDYTEVLKALTFRQRQILCHYLGIANHKKLTFEEIAQQENLSKDYVKLQFKIAIRKLQNREIIEKLKNCDNLELVELVIKNISTRKLS